MFSAICKEYGNTLIDFFATRANTELPFHHVYHSRSHGLKRGHFSTQSGWSQRFCLLFIHSSKSGPFESVDPLESLHDPCSSLASERMVCQPFSSSGGCPSQASNALELAGSTSCMEVSWGLELLRLHAWKLLSNSSERNIAPCKATFQHLAEFYLYLQKELKLTVSAIKRYRLAHNHVFILTSMDIASDRVICRMFSS